MQARGETNDEVCQYNDFALVKIDPADVATKKSEGHIETDYTKYLRRMH